MRKKSDVYLNLKRGEGEICVSFVGCDPFSRILFQRRNILENEVEFSIETEKISRSRLNRSRIWRKNVLKGTVRIRVKNKWRHTGVSRIFRPPLTSFTLRVYVYFRTRRLFLDLDALLSFLWIRGSQLSMSPIRENGRESSTR